MAGRYFSSTSSTARVASGALASAETSPASMFAPNALDAICCPIAPSAAVISLVVVVFPLVPVTRTICRPRASSESRSGFSRSPMTPPMTEPSPRPASREARPAAPPTVVARRARRGRPGRRDGGLLVLIGPDAIRYSGAIWPARSGAAPAPVEALRRRAEIGRRLGLARAPASRRRASAAAAFGFRSGPGSRSHRGGLAPEFLQRQQGGGAEDADTRIRVGQDHLPAVGPGIGDDHRAGWKLLEFVLL